MKLNLKLLVAFMLKLVWIRNGMNNLIKNLYDLELELKKENNPAEAVIKLLMNPMYGKLLLNQSKQILS